MHSLKCKVRSVECGVWSEERSVERGVQSLRCKVRSVECRV